MGDVVDAFEVPGLGGFFSLLVGSLGRVGRVEGVGPATGNWGEGMTRGVERTWYGARKGIYTSGSYTIADHPRSRDSRASGTDSARGLPG